MNDIMIIVLSLIWLLSFSFLTIKDKIEETNNEKEVKKCSKSSKRS